MSESQLKLFNLKKNKTLYMELCSTPFLGQEQQLPEASIRLFEQTLA